MSSISAGLSQGTALVSTGDTTGELVLKTNGGTTAVTIGTDQSVTLAAGLTTASPTVISVNSTDPALRITQVGTGNALRVEDSANPDATPFVVDADGNVLTINNRIGYVQNVTVLPVATALSKVGLLQWSGNSGTSQLTLGQQVTSSAPAIAAFYKARGGNTATPTIVSSGDATGSLRIHGYDGTNFIESARIEAQVDGTPGTNDMPGRLVFSTTADGASTPTERMRIDSSGNLLFNSGYGSVATAYGCRAWVNFNGTGTVAIREDGNVSSITDNGTGDYTINFTNAMPDINYAASSYAHNNSDNSAWIRFVSGPANSIPKTTTTFRITSLNVAWNAVDTNQIDVSIFR